MPSGTGKTVSLLSLIVAYIMVNPGKRKLIYCSRTVPEIEKALLELKQLMEFRESALSQKEEFLALGLSSRKNLCVHPSVVKEKWGKAVDAKCRSMTASWVRNRVTNSMQEKASSAAVRSRKGRSQGHARRIAGHSSRDPISDSESTTHQPDLNDQSSDIFSATSSQNDYESDQNEQLCEFYEGLENADTNAALPVGVYTLEELREWGRSNGMCPYFLSRRMLAFANVIIYSYHYLLDPKVAELVSREMGKDSIIVFDEAHNIGSFFMFFVNF
jgi:DNA excision repair protein ERCC-2